MLSRILVSCYFLLDYIGVKSVIYAKVNRIFFNFTEVQVSRVIIVLLLYIS